MPKFMTLVKGSEHHAPPPPELFEAINQLMIDAGKRLVSVGGLLQSDKGAKARLSSGKVTVTDGPFTEVKEVIGGFCDLRCGVHGRSEGMDASPPRRAHQTFPGL